MSYKIEKEGFEMYGFKLGQMTKQGRVIGFDENDRQCGIVVECNSNSLVRMSIGITIVLEGCEDCNYEYVNKNLIEIIEQSKISLRHDIWDSTLIVQTLHCEPFDLVKKNGFELIPSDSTRLCKNYAYIGCREGNTDTYHFNTQVEAQSYLDTLLELVEMVNNPEAVVDLKAYRFTNVSGFTVRVDDEGNVYLLYANGLTLMYWTRKLPLPIIKSQLEQILEHLNVKAEVRI